MGKIIRLVLQATGAITIAGLLLGFGLLGTAGYWMRVDEMPLESDYILPLAGNDNRLIEAIRLYDQGFGKSVLLSMARPYPVTEVDDIERKIGYPDLSRLEYVSLLIQQISPNTIAVESFGNGHISTAEEVEALRTHFNGKTPSLLVVTSPYHTRRAKLILNDILPESRITVVATQEGAFETLWWKDQHSAQKIIMEVFKTIYYIVGGAFRSTDAHNS